MNYLSVKAVPGRVARTAPNGEMIPHDRFVKVPDTAYIRRLLDHHGDIILQPKSPEPDRRKPTPDFLVPPGGDPAEHAQKKKE